MTYYFYDLETSGFNPRTSRIMQFAGQRTDMDLKPLGKPDNILIKLSPDVLPDPGAVLVHGITPQQAITEGISEAEFIKYLVKNVFLPDTVFIGYNSIRFDDEFMRYTLWRNFADSYEWHWKDGCSRWDLLDVVRMTRALRPNGINWPFDIDGKPSNRLEMVAAVNKLEHANVHDALSDILAVIDLAKLIKTKQPKIFDYLFKIRGKKAVAPLVTNAQPLVYTSGRYPSQYEKTTVAVMVASTDTGALMYDLRIDPEPFIKLKPAQLAKLWRDFAKDAPYFPVKAMAFNKAPAIAPLNVLDKTSLNRLQLSMDDIEANFKKLKAAKDLDKRLLEAYELTKPKKQTKLMTDILTVDEQLYDGFITDADKAAMSAIRAVDAETINKLQPTFVDERLKLLFPLYKARNYPKSLSSQERTVWDNFRFKKLVLGDDQSRANRYFNDLEQQAKRPDLTDQQRYLLEELNLYGQSIIPDLG